MLDTDFEIFNLWVKLLVQLGKWTFAASQSDIRYVGQSRPSDKPDKRRLLAFRDMTRNNPFGEAVLY